MWEEGERWWRGEGGGGEGAEGGEGGLAVLGVRFNGRMWAPQQPVSRLRRENEGAENSPPASLSLRQQQACQSQTRPADTSTTVTEKSGEARARESLHHSKGSFQNTGQTDRNQ